ncbi:NADH-quinone oxidoreductase subunit A [Leadbetterella sp. DM7]|uniref:NADH-quinone oxidoreductase subunit A n=1 Tax=Leadbetterella sp. DM7 TaxID=3235085 RepID=UPI00349EC734
MISEFGYILLFILGSVLLVVIMLGISRLMRPDRPGGEKNEVYESGELPIGNARLSFNIRFYIVAIVFLLFDVELVLLFPWSVVFGDAALLEKQGSAWLWFAGIEMLIFIGVLVLGLVYVWRKGHLDWILPESKTEEFRSPVPPELYDGINKKYS